VADPEVIERIDSLIQLPSAHIGWDF